MYTYVPPDPGSMCIFAWEMRGADHLPSKYTRGHPEAGLDMTEADVYTHIYTYIHIYIYNLFMLTLNRPPIELAPQFSGAEFQK